jgi:serine protease inhibitor
MNCKLCFLANSTSEDKNLVVSPYSLNLALSMLFLGTTSLTSSSSQLRSLMHFDGISYVDIHNQFKNVIDKFDNNYYKTKMKTGHGLYVAKDVTVAPHYNRALSQFYHSNIQVRRLFTYFSTQLVFFFTPQY